MYLFFLQHIDLVSYYLRKKGKYCKKINYSFTIMETVFYKRLEHVRTKMDDPSDEAKLWVDNNANMNDLVCLRMFGDGVYCGKRWDEVDNVFLPIMAGTNHWILGKFEIVLRKLFIYDSYKYRLSYNKDTPKAATIPPSLIPYHLHNFQVLFNRNDIMQSEVYKSRDPLPDLEIVYIEGLPQQSLWY